MPQTPTALVRAAFPCFSMVESVVSGAEQNRNTLASPQCLYAGALRRLESNDFGLPLDRAAPGAFDMPAAMRRELRDLGLL
jgi:hypothetical protein